MVPATLSVLRLMVRTWVLKVRWARLRVKQARANRMTVAVTVSD